MKRVIPTLAVLLLFVVLGLPAPSVRISPLYAQEIVTLTAPQTRTTSTYTVSDLDFDLLNSRIVVSLRSNHGEPLTKVYDATTTPTGAALLKAFAELPC